MYTALVLNEDSVKLLKDRCARTMNGIPPNGGGAHDWALKCHHMTCNMGKAENGPAKDYVGKEYDLHVTHIASNQYVMAVAVESDVPSSNRQKHITIAVNERLGGKAKMSNDLTEWIEVERLTLRGKVMEVA